MFSPSPNFSSGGHAALFGLLVVVTHLNRKLLWGLAIAVISLKLYRLLKYYAWFDYLSSSNIYNHDYWVFFYEFGVWFVGVGVALFGCADPDVAVS